MRTWLGWSARHKWVSRSLARDEWIARTSDDQIVSNVTACKLALTTPALDYLTANDGADFLRAARALSLHFPPIQRVADARDGDGVLPTGHPRARHGDAEDRRREGLTVPKYPRLLRRFLQSFRCPLVGPAGLARRRRVQLFPGQKFAYGQDLDAGMLAPR